MDGVVINLLTHCARDRLVLSPSCVHLKGHGGLKRAVADIHAKLDGYQFVCKSDVKGYYESIDQYTLLNQIDDQVTAPLLRHYCYQIVRRCLEDGGEHWDIEQGISRGCAMSRCWGLCICWHWMSA